MRRAAHMAVLAAVAAAASAASAACGGGSAGGSGAVSVTPAVPVAGAERVLAMLPQGAQIVVEIDLARLRANPVIGGVITRALADDDGAAGRPPADATPAALWLRGILRVGGRAGAAATAAAPAAAGPAPAAAGAPLAVADEVVLAAYGVGTAQAATLTLLAARRAVAGATRIADGVYAVGPPEWVAQAQQRVERAAGGGAAAIQAAPELLALRAHAMPAEAPGASLRITAQLPFDARIALTRQTGLEIAPAQLSAWADVVDDVALVIDCDASDPGAATGRSRSDGARRLASTLRAMFDAVADQPTIRQLGLPPALTGARLIARGTWVRAVVAIGPARLRRVAERAAGLFGAPVPPARAAPAVRAPAAPATPAAASAAAPAPPPPSPPATPGPGAPPP